MLRKVSTRLEEVSSSKDLYRVLPDEVYKRVYKIAKSDC